MDLDSVPKKEESVVLSFRMSKRDYDRLAKLKKNPDVDVPGWLRKIFEAELDKIGA